MINVNQIPSIVDHLQNISQIYKVINQNQIQILCPFCDDSQRTKAHEHGHLYIQSEDYIFHCFRCEASGTLLKLLISTEFKDYDIIQQLSKNIKYNFGKDYYHSNSIIKPNQRNKLKENITQGILYTLQNNQKKYYEFKNYLFNRLGNNIDFSDFLIYPGNIQTFNTCDFYNSESELVLQRYISNQSSFRFKINKTSSQLYYFQDKDFEKYQRIVLTEGPFDMLNLYLYNYLFKDCIFFSISGKKYTSIIEKLIYQDLFIGNYQINLIFDSDVKNYFSYIYKARQLVEYLNPDIEVKGYIPLFENSDVGDYPGVIEV